MSTVSDSVQNRFAQAQIDLTATQIGIGLLLLAVTSFVVLFMQDPLVHDSMHNFRHAAGITCH
jgi:hypothetical protein